MAPFKCEFCQVTLTSDSSSTRTHHFAGKAHIASCNAYWNKVKQAQAPSYDQTQEIRKIWKIPGLTESLVSGEVEQNLGKAVIIEPKVMR